MYKACIFDLDGTLTDTLESLTYSVNETLKELKLKKITQEQCRSFVGNGARCPIERALVAGGDLEKSQMEPAMEIYGRIFGENCTYHVTPYDGIAEMLEQLKKSGIKLAVLSNKPHLQAVDVVKEFFGEDVFSYVQGQIDSVPRKPDPSAALMIAEKLGCKKEECVYVGDSEVDIKTGHAAGMKTVSVSWGFRSREILKENGAEHIIDRPEELIHMIGKGI